MLFSFVTPGFAADETTSPANIYGVEISPDGSHYAVLRDVDDQRALVIYEADNASANPMAIGLGDVEIGDFEWGGDDYVLIRVVGEKGVATVQGLQSMTVSRWLSISRLTGKSTTLFGNHYGTDYYYYINSAGQLLAALPLEGEYSLFARSFIATRETGATRLQDTDETPKYSLQRANLATGSVRRMAEGAETTIDWVVDPSGAVVARIDQNETSKAINIFAADGARRLEKVGTISGDIVERQEIDFLGRGSSPRRIQAFLKDGTGARLVEYDLDAGAFADPVFTPAAGFITSAPYDAREARARIVYYADGRERAYHLDEADRIDQASLEKALPGAAVALISRSVDGDRLIARASYFGKAEYYLYVKTGKRLELVAAD